jgi:nitroimidazol reductase NimA-like FMN-containing flavoprotein (pyridoxamine 5'-phosphate oxidase superfamily)
MEEDAAIATFLTTGGFGVLATSHEGQPYTTPVTYWYDPESHAIYLHGAKTGRTRANLTLNPRVSFNVTEMGELVPGERAEDFGLHYRSVTVFGTAQLVEDRAESERALMGLMRKYFPDHTPGEDYPPLSEGEINRTAVYRLKIEEWSGKERQGKE